MLQKKQSEEHIAENLLIKEMQPAILWGMNVDECRACFHKITWLSATEGRPPKTTFAP